MPNIEADDALHVAVGVIRDEYGRVLIARRAPNVHQGDLWEFPGGKIEQGETLPEALGRELREELGIHVETSTFWFTHVFSYPERQVALHVCRVERFSGTPSGMEGQPVRWVSLEALAEASFPAANQRIVEALRSAFLSPTMLPLPLLYFIADPSRCPPGQFLPRLASVLDNGVRWVQLRAKGMPAAEYQRLAQDVLALVRAHAGRLLINGDPDWVRDWGVDGVQLSQERVQALQERSVDPAWGHVGVSCHNARELHEAARIGAHFALLSPVFPTASHPGAPSLGPEEFGRLLRQSVLPVLALGGIRPDRVATVFEQGAAGIGILGGILDAEEPGAAVRAYLDRMPARCNGVGDNA